ncbi:MFS transporter [Burkholderia sp. Bp8963]|uniref:MFS transporter n=1 Tax=Burkholderia sp. Bp8963 TaxID=2184547 RepID=UPI0021AB24A4|nr:MFS transporter [Burkholderia sp. Bp8963]
MIPDFAAHDQAGQLLPFRESLLAMLGISFVSMLVALDQTIVGTALPRIVADLQGFDLYAWVATSYMLTAIVTIPIFGRLGDLFGRKPFLLAAIVLFTVASLLCGVATNMLFLVIARGLQGIGGGILAGTMFATVAELFPDPRIRLRWLVFVSAAYLVANAAGPSLGGMLTQYGGWRFVFFVNLPVGLVSLLFVHAFLPDLRRRRTGMRVKIDWIGALLLASTLGMLQGLIELAPTAGMSAPTIGLGLACVAGAAALLFWERRVAHPIVPIAMLADANLAALFAMSVLGGFALFTLVFYVPLLFQGGFGMSPHESGVLITPLLLGSTVGGIVNNRIITRVRPANRILYAGFACFTCAALGLAAINGKVPHALWMAYMGMGGFGMGLVASNLTLFAQQLAARDHLGSATALLQSLRLSGGMLGTAITGMLVSRLYAIGAHGSLDAYQASQWFRSLANPELHVDRAEQAALISRVIMAGHTGDPMMHMAREALVRTVHLGLGLAAAAALIALGLVWFVPPVRVERIDD